MWPDELGYCLIWWKRVSLSQASAVEAIYSLIYSNQLSYMGGIGWSPGNYFWEIPGNGYYHQGPYS